MTTAVLTPKQAEFRDEYKRNIAMMLTPIYYLNYENFHLCCSASCSTVTAPGM